MSENIGKRAALTFRPCGCRDALDAELMPKSRKSIDAPGPAAASALSSRNLLAALGGRSKSASAAQPAPGSPGNNTPPHAGSADPMGADVRGKRIQASLRQSS